MPHRCGTWRSYPVSTAGRGSGNRRDSYQTPLGRHRIVEKIGAGLPINTIFQARRPCGIYQPEVDGSEGDWILTRILWLGGCQRGVNRRGAVDTQARYIYIHGTHDEARIGTPCSHGCIRMRNCDMLELFDRVICGESVVIRP